MLNLLVHQVFGATFWYQGFVFFAKGMTQAKYTMGQFVGERLYIAFVVDKAKIKLVNTSII